MRYAGEEMFRDFTLNGYWWLPPAPDGAAYGTLSYSVDRIKLRLDRAFTPELDTAYGVGSVKAIRIVGNVFRPGVGDLAAQSMAQTLSEVKLQSLIALVAVGVDFVHNT